MPERIAGANARRSAIRSAVEHGAIMPKSDGSARCPATLMRRRWPGFFVHFGMRRDFAGARNEGLSGKQAGQHAARLRWAGRTRSAAILGGAIRRVCFPVPQQERRLTEGAPLGWHRPLPFCQAPGARSFRLAAAHRGRCCTQPVTGIGQHTDKVRTGSDVTINLLNRDLGLRTISLQTQPRSPYPYVRCRSSGFPTETVASSA